MHPKAIPYLWPKWPKSIPYLYDQNGWKTIPFGAAHLYSPYKGVAPPGMLHSRTSISQWKLLNLRRKRRQIGFLPNSLKTDQQNIASLSPENWIEKTWWRDKTNRPTQEKRRREFSELVFTFVSFLHAIVININTLLRPIPYVLERRWHELERRRHIWFCKNS